tara:strand:+ start:4656 stop:7457 length:2802 start_codon:yes stop_codon:yes gene_type:complete
MKYIKILACLAIFVFINKTYTQDKRNFTEYFTTSNGISGKVYLSTKPVTFSAPYVVIQADKIIVTSVSTSEGKISGKELADFGISLPFECSNGGFYVSGSVHWKAYATIGYDSGTFKTGGRVTLGSSLGNSNQEIKLSQQALDRHREGVKAGLGSLWEKTGSVLSVNISDVNGADFGTIINAVNKYTKRKADELALTNEIKNIERSLHSYPKNTSELEYNLGKYQQLASISDDSKYESKIQEIRNRIKQIAEEAEASNLDSKLVNNDNKEDTSNEKRDFDNKSFIKDKDSNEDLKRNQETQKSIKDQSYRKAEMEIRFRDQEKFISSNYYVKSGDYLRALVELNQVSGYNYSTAREEIKKIQYQALGQLSEQNLSRLKKYTQHINFNAKDANQVLTDYQKKYNYIVSEFNKSKSNIVSKTVTIAAQRVGENLGQGKNADAAAEGIIGIISATSAAQEAKDAREEAVRELNYKKNNTLYKLRDDLLKEYQDASNYYYEQAIKSTAENNEIVATSNYEYYECRLASIKSNFSTENANWAKNGKCIPQKNNKINTELKDNNFYEISIRKFYQALKYPYDSKERKDFLAASELYLSKVSTLDNLALETNNMVITILLASDSKKLKDLRKKISSDFLAPMDEQNSLRIIKLNEFLKFLENPSGKNLSIPDYSYEASSTDNENIDWLALANRYLIKHEEKVIPELSNNQTNLESLKIISERELTNLNKAKELFKKAETFSPKLEQYIKNLQGHINSNNALDLVKEKKYSEDISSNFDQIKYKSIDNKNKNEFVVASMLEDFAKITDYNLLKKISYEVINSKGSIVGSINGIEYSLIEKLSCLCHKSDVFNGLIKQSVGSLKKTNIERISLLLFMAQNYKTFNKCTEEQIKKRFELISSYGVEKQININRINNRFSSKISNNQTIISRTGDKYLLTKKIL